MSSPKTKRRVSYTPLLACPFCGSTEISVQESAIVTYQVHCHGCHVETAWYDDRDDAVIHWNMRRQARKNAQMPKKLSCGQKPGQFVR